MKNLIVLFFFLFFTLSILSSGVIDSQDGFLYLAVARNIYYKGEITAPANEYTEGKNIPLYSYKGKNGKTYSHTGIGYSLALLPAIALTDIIYKLYHIDPPINFPLENDWLIFLTASFTNSFFGTMLGIILFLYLLELSLSKKQALFISLITVLGTNIVIYTKHSFAHMMFLFFLTSSFFFIKKYSKSHFLPHLILSSISFGVLTITYNQTFLLTLLPIVIYYYLLNRQNFSTKKIIMDLILSLIIILPFILILFGFENLRAEPGKVNYGNPISLTNLALSPFKNLPISAIFEGIYGQLLSPGRSIFLYSPILLIPIIFWHKIRSSIKPELIIFIVFNILYISFMATQYELITNKPGGYLLLWHGELSWGPRYILVLVPFGMIIVGSIFKYLSKKERFFIFYPLLLISLYINMLGILIPYQTKLHNLEKEFYINGQQYTNFIYSNLLPRYSPIIGMSKNLVKLGQNFPKTFDHGIYNVRFYDGIDFPFNVGPERWRVIEGKGYISFDDNKRSPVKELAFGVINHPVSESSESARIQFSLNNIPLLEKPLNLDITKQDKIVININENILKPQRNQLVIAIDYGKAEVIRMHKQILGFQSFDINGQRQNMESIDVPYISPLGPKLAGVNYQNWGGTNQDPWKTWDIHTQMFERLPDFWWIRNLYYWDIPKSWILIPFTLNVLFLVFFGFKLLKFLSQDNRKNS